jgi:hypothetical protein
MFGTIRVYIVTTNYDIFFLKHITQINILDNYFLAPKQLSCLLQMNLLSLVSQNTTITMHHQPGADKFSVDEWLKSIDIWDENFDYVMHDDHWLTSKWSPDCEKCQSANEDLIDLNETFDLYRSAIADTPKVNHHRPRTPATEIKYQQQPQSQPQQQQQQQSQQQLQLQQQQQQQQLQQQQQQQQQQLQLQQQQQQQQLQQQQQQQQGVTSKIPKIPVRLSRQF